MARWFDWVLDQFGLRKKQPKPTKPAPPPPIPPETVPEPIPQPPAPIPPPPTPAPSGTRAVVTLDDGTLLTYDPANQVREDFPYFEAQFRSDEIVFNWGLSVPRDRAATDPRIFSSLKRYRVEIFRDGVPLADITAPSPGYDIDRQLWHTRWRWQEKPKPVIRTPAELIAARLVPPYKASASTGMPVPVVPRYGPLSTTGILRRFPSTAYHEDIGPMPSWFARWLCTGEGAQAVLDYAEGANSFPWIVRDHLTRGPYDLAKYPEMTVHWMQPNEPKVTADYNSADAKLFGIELDDAHSPNPAVLAYLMTGDLYHLEAAQYAATWLLASDPYPFGGMVKNTAWGRQTRGAAHTLNNLVHVWRATPDIVPPGLLPKSYWQGRLEANAADLEHAYIENSLGVSKSVDFHSATATGAMSLWQESMLCNASLLAVYYGCEAFRKFAFWKLDAIKARHNGKSGWPSSNPLGRQVAYISPAAFENSHSWGELAANDGITETPDGKLFTGYEFDYPAMDRAPLVLGSLLGDAECTEILARFDPALRAAGYQVPWQWAVG